MLEFDEILTVHVYCQAFIMSYKFPRKGTLVHTSPPPLCSVLHILLEVESLYSLTAVLLLNQVLLLIFFLSFLILNPVYRQSTCR